HQVMQHVVERARLGARLAPVRDEKLRAERADVPGREIALRHDIRPGPVKERRLAVAERFLERGERSPRGKPVEAAQALLQRQAAGRDLEIGGAKARLAE